MDSPLSPKTKTAVPTYLTNGAIHAAQKNSPLQYTSINAEERDRLTASIRSSNNERQPVDLDAADRPQANGHPPFPTSDNHDQAVNHVQLDVSARDPRDEATPHPAPPSTSRPASPYTLNPPIDFDGLSWPSESGQHIALPSRAESKNRPWDTGTTGSHTSSRS